MKSYINVPSFILLSSLLTSCYHTSEFLYHDSGIQMHEYEMVAKLKNTKGKKIKNNKSNKITISDNIYLPEEPNAIEDKIVSINVTEETPIVQVINELARMSGTDIQIDPSIIGGVNLNLKDKPLRYVFNRICGLTDVRYKEKYGIVVFERDIPYFIPRPLRAKTNAAYSLLGNSIATPHEIRTNSPFLILSPASS